MLGLAFTHNLGILDAAAVTDDLFPDREQEITFGVSLETTGLSAIGIVFEFGSATAGAKLAVGSGKLYLAAGNATPASNTGVDGEVALDTLGIVGGLTHVVVALRPASGQARLWVAGELVLRLDAPSSTPMLNDVWADADNGAVGADAAGTGSTQRTPETVNSAPVDFILSEVLRVAQGQVPVHFDG